MPKIHDWIQQTLEEAHGFFTVEPQKLLDSFTHALLQLEEIDVCKQEFLQVVHKEFKTMDVEDFLTVGSNNMPSLKKKYHHGTESDRIIRWFIEALNHWCESDTKL
jgi:hypothetical protein